MFMKSDRSITIWLISIVAILFGLLTIKSGGSVIFVDGPDRLAAGNYMPFVVWFNFLAGFIYLVAGAGLWLKKQWAIRLSIFIAVATLIVFIAFGIAILIGQAYEMRTVAAMSLRTIVWTVISMFAYYKINRQLSYLCDGNL
jgi:hypothetical protein